MDGLSIVKKVTAVEQRYPCGDGRAWRPVPKHPQLGVLALKGPREIRLYPNRRLYDPVVSRYIKYDDAFSLLREGFELSVKRKADGTDFTRKVLLDVVIRHEDVGADRGEQAFTDSFVQDLIRVAATGNSARVSAFLDFTLETLFRADDSPTVAPPAHFKAPRRRAK
jgi:polyhydroxyalkanoate synthesis repressor PhaR